MNTSRGDKRGISMTDKITLDLRKLNNESVKQELFSHIKKLCRLLTDSDDIIEVKYEPKYNIFGGERI